MASEDDFDPERHLAERRAALPVALAWLVTVPLLTVALLRVVAHDATFELVVLNAMTPWLYVPAWLALGLGVTFRKWNLCVAAGTVAIAHVAWLDPRGLVAAEASEPRASARFRVMSANVLMVNRDTEGISAEILSVSPDLLLVQELAPAWHARFERADLVERFPYRHAVARSDSFGIGLYSRRPFRVEERELSGLPALRAELELGGRRLALLGVHTLPPRTPEYTARWNEMLETIAGWIRDERGALLLAGDLNATPDARWYGRLLDLGLRGAHEECGRGLATTWPNGRFPFPPIRLDHFLVSATIDVLAVAEGEGRGSDHRPIIGDFTLR